MKFNHYCKNWRTTLLGVGAICAALGDVATQIATKDWDINRLGADLTGLLTGCGLLFARDSAVSEQEHAENTKRMDVQRDHIADNKAAIAELK